MRGEEGTVLGILLSAEKSDEEDIPPSLPAPVAVRDVQAAEALPRWHWSVRSGRYGVDTHPLERVVISRRTTLATWLEGGE